VYAATFGPVNCRFLLALLGLSGVLDGDIRNMPARDSLVRRGLRHAPYFAAWWVLSMLLWLLFTSTVAPSEGVVGMCASLITAAAGEMVRTRSSIEFRFRPRWFPRAWLVPVHVARDTGMVFAALVRHATGRRRVRGIWAAIPFESGGDGSVASARRALAEIGASISPNSVAVGVDQDDGVLLVHQLVSDPGSVEDLVRRSD
jgi:multisubunit Na+/H+ antiporter MnhE subunit